MSFIKDESDLFYHTDKQKIASELKDDLSYSHAHVVALLVAYVLIIIALVSVAARTRKLRL